MTTDSNIVEEPRGDRVSYEEDVRRNDERAAPPSRVSWGAILAGTVMALASFFVLGMLGAAIGLGAFDPANEQNPLQGFGVGTGIWLALQIVISLFVGGWIAGRLAGKPRGLDGVLNGAVVWGLTVLLAIFGFSMLVRTVVSGAASAAQTTISAAGSAIGSVAEQAVPEGQRGEVVGAIQQEAQQLMRQSGKEQLQPDELAQETEALQQLAVETAQDAATSPQQAGAILSSALDRALRRADGVVDAADREALVNILVARTDQSREEAQQTVDNWVAAYQEGVGSLEEAGSDIVGTAETVATDVSDAISTALWWTLLGVALGIIAACLGGWLGSLKIEPTRDERTPRRTYYPAGEPA